MIPQQLQSLFWDVNLADFRPAAYPEYTIFRVLEYGDRQAVRWMREHFSESQIKQVIRSERRLTARSANFWALVYHMPASEVTALQRGR